MSSNAGLLDSRTPTQRASGSGDALRPRARDRAKALHWSGIGLAALLVLTAFAYLWDLSASGYANSFYAAAVQAGTKSWKAFLFGSIDSSNFITVDKPPASLWVMALSGRIFGFSSWSLLVPQALEGVAAVALLYAGVRRWFGSTAGLAAGALLACTPVAALMFRFDNPDALLVALLVAGAYCLVRALERGATKWLLAAGAMVGFAFLTKMMQAFLVLPGFALVYMVAAPVSLRRRTLQTLAGGLAVLVSAGWWVALVELWPAGSRPMIDGSPDNGILNLITGYNGLGRIFGSGGGGGAGGGGAGFSGPTGVLRLFNSLMGGQASWLIPAGLAALLLGLWATRRAPRTDRTRAALLLWGSWLVVSGLVFSLGSGVIHTYYTIALAPAIAALVAIGGRMLWERRSSPWAAILAAGGLAGTAAWAWVLLDRTPSWQPWLRTLVLVTGGAAVIGILAIGRRRALRRRLAAPVLALALIASLSGPVAYAAQTVTTAHTGSVPSAGPEITGGGFGGMRGAGGAGGPGHGGFTRPGASESTRAGGTGGFNPPSGSGSSTGSTGPAAAGAPGPASAGTRPGGFSGAGGMGGGESVSRALITALKTNPGKYRWVAATSGSQSAAALELASGGLPVMAIGGFSGQGGNLSLAQFEQYISAGQIHYYIASGDGGGFGGGARGPGSGSSSITSWVASHFKAITIGGQTVYDLTQSTS